MQQRIDRDMRKLSEITIKTNTRDILPHATPQAEGFDHDFVADIDVHVAEIQFWPEIIELIDNDVIRPMGQARRAATTALLNVGPGKLHRNIHGRIPHQTALAESVDDRTR
jgi:uncharacterized protein